MLDVNLYPLNIPGIELPPITPAAWIKNFKVSNGVSKEIASIDAP